MTGNASYAGQQLSVPSNVVQVATPAWPTAPSTQYSFQVTAFGDSGSRMVKELARRKSRGVGGLNAESAPISPRKRAIPNGCCYRPRRVRSAGTALLPRRDRPSGNGVRTAKFEFRTFFSSLYSILFRR